MSYMNIINIHMTFVLVRRLQIFT